MDYKYLKTSKIQKRKKKKKLLPLSKNPTCIIISFFDIVSVVHCNIALKKIKNKKTD